MKVQIAGDPARRLGIRLTQGEYHLSAFLSKPADNWVLEYAGPRGHSTVNIAPGRDSWQAALRRALADCVLRLP